MEFPDRWLRIHSLPLSKRYATTGEERGEILRRQNEVADRVLGAGARCLFVIATFPTDPAPPPLAALTADGWAARWRDNPSLHEMVDAGMQFAACKCTWTRGAFDEVLTDVANDRTNDLLLMNIESGRVYAPYDGGADLILRNPAEREELRSELGDWISRRADGL